MNAVFEFVESHAGLLSTISSVCMLIVTAIYAVITWWQVRYSKQAVIESAKHNKEEKQPFIVPVISSISGSAFDTSSYLRVQLQYDFTLENVGDSPAVTVYTFLYVKLQNADSENVLYSHLMPAYLHSLSIGKQQKCSLHLETTEFRSLISDLEICYTKNLMRIATDPSVTPFPGPIVVLRCIYKNMMGQWFETVLEHEMFDVYKSKPDSAISLSVDDDSNRVTNENIVDGDKYEGMMINPSYSKLTRTMVDSKYLQDIMSDCKKRTYTWLE